MREHEQANQHLTPPTDLSAPCDAGDGTGSQRALELRHLTYRHDPGGCRAVTDVTLQVDGGAMLALVGPSGSGKTTLLRLAAGLESPDSGDIRVGGVSQLGVPSERRGMTMMFQRPLLFPHLNVLDNVAFADRVNGLGRRAARARASRYLALVHLSQLAQRRPRTLSGGQEQRVALARALAAQPRVLLLDEPFTALDAHTRASMHDLLAEVRALLAPTTILVTHDMDEAAMADTVAVIADGRIQQTGPIDGLYAGPVTVDVARVLGGFSEIAGHAHGGLHHCSFGTMPLAPHAADLQGPAVLLARRESLHLVADTDPAARYSGRVVSVQRVGMRQYAHVEPDPTSASRDRAAVGTRVWAEAPLGIVIRSGERTGIAPVPGGLWALPACGGPVGDVRAGTARLTSANT